jgi:hypothetical protein
MFKTMDLRAVKLNYLRFERKMQLGGISPLERRESTFQLTLKTSNLEESNLATGGAQLARCYSMLEVIVRQRGRSWEWRVIDETGATLMRGRKKSRQSASYNGHRALFQILAVGRKSNPAPLRR